MNRNKPLIVALLVLIVLVAVVLLVWRDPFERGSKPDYSGLLPYRSGDSIDRITVTNREGTFTAEKRNNRWWLTEPRELPADEGQLKTAATALEILTVTDTASRKLERQAEYGLAKNNPERVAVKIFAAGKEMLDFAAGKRTPDGLGTFIVLAKEPQIVYVASQALPAFFGQGIKEWRSKVIVELPPDKIERMRLATGKGLLDLVKEGGDQWRKQDDPGWYADSLRLGQVLGMFSRLTWVEIVDEPPFVADYGFNAPQASVTVTAEGKDHLLIFGKEVEKSAGNCWLKLEGDPKVYQVKKAVLERLTRDLDYYKGEPPKAAQEQPQKEN